MKVYGFDTLSVRFRYSLRGAITFGEGYAVYLSVSIFLHFLRFFHKKSKKITIFVA